MFGSAEILKEDVKMHVCKRCRRPYPSPAKAAGYCPECSQWLADTKLTHCHRKACDDPDSPTKFDEVRHTKYGDEYHCPNCHSWINFGLLAEVFSTEKTK